MADERTGTVFNIQRYSIHDGPGIRTVVFLKGCPLRCLWCSNPESQNPNPEWMFSAEKCSGCLRCVDACPSGARKRLGGKLGTDMAQCLHCGKCAEACPAGALRRAGTQMTVEQVIRAVEQDRPFYDESGGGVTLSGGEPAFQPDFAEEILGRCQDRYIHTAIETTGLVCRQDLERVAARADLVLYDLKHADLRRHEEGTGSPNGLVLDNARALAESGKQLIIRIPLIPEFNADPPALAGICRFVQSLPGVREVHLLPYHEYGRSKYDRLNREYPLAHISGLDSDDPRVALARRIFEDEGFVVQVGG